MNGKCKFLLKETVNGFSNFILIAKTRASALVNTLIDPWKEQNNVQLEGFLINSSDLRALCITKPEIKDVSLEKSKTSLLKIQT